jgi:hypothetical protein
MRSTVSPEIPLRSAYLYSLTVPVFLNVSCYRVIYICRRIDLFHINNIAHRQNISIPQKNVLCVLVAILKLTYYRFPSVYEYITSYHFVSDTQGTTADLDKRMEGLSVSKTMTRNLVHRRQRLWTSQEPLSWPRHSQHEYSFLYLAKLTNEPYPELICNLDPCNIS